jgi:hypothetical protein
MSALRASLLCAEPSPGVALHPLPRLAASVASGRATYTGVRKERIMLVISFVEPNRNWGAACLGYWRGSGKMPERIDLTGLNDISMLLCNMVDQITTTLRQYLLLRCNGCEGARASYLVRARISVGFLRGRERSAPVLASQSGSARRVSM